MEKMETSKWDYRRNGDGKAIIAWLLDDKEYQVHCTQFEYFEDNLRACEQAITLVYRVYDEYKVSTADCEDPDLATFFQGFRALPTDEMLALPAPTMAPWEILGCDRNATVSEINKAFQQASKKAHPDTGGSHEEFTRLTEAKKQMIDLRM